MAPHCKSDFVSGPATKPYKITGIHLLIISYKTTSSKAIRPISPKIASFLSDRKTYSSTSGPLSLVSVIGAWF